jgi:hypothetical protein
MLSWGSEPVQQHEVATQESRNVSDFLNGAGALAPAGFASPRAKRSLVVGGAHGKRQFARSASFLACLAICHVNFDSFEFLFLA